jgi:uncharacterized protein YjbJ (UPF0337 family)
VFGFRGSVFVKAHLFYSVFRFGFADRGYLMRSRVMNWDRIEGNWKQFKGKVKEKWGKLTDEDLTVVEGKREQLVGKIQERYGCAKDEAERELNNFADRMSA